MSDTLMTGPTTESSPIETDTTMASNTAELRGLLRVAEPCVTIDDVPVLFDSGPTIDESGVTFASGYFVPNGSSVTAAGGYFCTKQVESATGSSISVSCSAGAEEVFFVGGQLRVL